MTSLCEVPKRKKPTMPTEVTEEEDIEETTTVRVPGIGETVNQEMKTKNPNLERTFISFQQHPKQSSTINPNAKTTVIHDDSEDEVDEAEKELEPSSSKQTESDPPPLKAYKPKISINLPLIDVLAGMPNYRKFLKDLARNKSSVEYLALDDLGASINLMPYLLYDSLSENTLKPTKMKLNLGVGDDRITFLIDKAMRHSHSNDDICFRVDVIDEATKEELDALLDESKPFSNTSAKISESSLDHEFKEFMAIKIEEIPD
ncbi:hypothetical protein Tco_1319159 [Tanacetum coccineum]